MLLNSPILNFDNIVIYSLCKELQDILGNTIIDVKRNIYNDILLHFENIDSKKGTIILSAQNQYPRVHIITYPPNYLTIYKPNYLTTFPSNNLITDTFLEYLKNFLINSTIEKIEQIDFDRIIKFDFTLQSAFSEIKKVSLFAEITGGHSNLILVNSETNKILSAEKLIESDKSYTREIMPNKDYIPIPKPDKLDFFSSNYNQFIEKIISIKDDISIASALQQSIMGVSNLFANEILYRAEIDSNLQLNQINKIHQDKLWSSFNELRNIVIKNNSEPVLYLLKKDDSNHLTTYPYSHLPYLLFYPFKLRHLENYTIQSVSSLNSAITIFYDEYVRSKFLHNFYNRLNNALKDSYKHSNKLLETLNKELDDIYKADEYKKFGELITVNLHSIKRGMKSAIVVDYYDDKEIEIPLDSALTPQENAQKYFKMYRKAHSGKAKVEDRINLVKEKLNIINEFQKRLSNCNSYDELCEIENELLSNKIVSQHSYCRMIKGYHSSVKRQPKKDDVKSSPHFKTYYTSDGWRVLVGRNNKENDLLTHHYSASDDIWFHVQGSAGSHVVLKRDGKKGEPSKQALIETASISAYHSKARHSSTVPVIYTEKRYVRKPKGAKPGLAVCTNEKTLFVTPKIPTDSK